MFLVFFPSQFCTVALEHSASAVRELAVRIILSLYQQHRAAVISHLPSKDDPTRKNFLYKTLFDGFAKIDGKLVESKARSFLFISLVQINLSVLLNIIFTWRMNLTYKARALRPSVCPLHISRTILINFTLSRYFDAEC